MADQAEENGKKGLLKWLGPKTEYRKLVSFLLSTRIHIIACSRAKQPVEEQIVDGRKTLVTMPWEPIQDKRLKFEMTIYVPMLLNGAYELEKPRLKVPGDLAHLFTGDLLTEETGAAIGEWVQGGKPVDHKFELQRKEAFEVAGAGTDFFTKWWNSAPTKAFRNKLRGDLKNLQSVAQAADDDIERKLQAAAQLRQHESDEDTLENPFGLQEVGPRAA